MQEQRVDQIGVQGIVGKHLVYLFRNMGSKYFISLVGITMWFNTKRTHLTRNGMRNNFLSIFERIKARIRYKYAVYKYYCPIRSLYKVIYDRGLSRFYIHHYFIDSRIVFAFPILISYFLSKN